jgi:hypothetical protein
MADDDRIRRAELARQEARETISEQAKTVTDIDEKAIQIFRVNIVLAGILVSGISIAVQSSNASTTALLNPFTKFGAVLLFGATVLASITYTSTNQRIGVSSDDITRRILNTDYDYDLIERGLAEEYSNWIATNYKSNIQNALLFTLTLLTTVMSICYFFLGAVEIYRASLPWYTNVGAGVLFLIVAKLSGLWGQLNRWHRITDPHKRFSRWLGAWNERLRDNASERNGDDKADIESEGTNRNDSSEIEHQTG